MTDDVNMLGENPQTIRENTGILLEVSKEIGLEVNPEKTKYMIMSRDEIIVRNGNIKIGNLSFEEVEKFKYLGATVTNINDTRDEIKHRINMGNSCYYSVEKLLSSSLLSKTLKVRIYKTVILPVVLYGCETWTLSLREEQRLRVFENKVFRKIFGAKRDEVTGEWRKLHNTELHALYSSPDIIRNIKPRRLRWAGHVALMGESRNAYRVWLFNDAVSTTRLFSIDEIGDSEMRPRIRHRLPGIHLTVGENLGKKLNQICARQKFQHNPLSPGCNETETLGHVLGFCRKMELLRNNRHHKARTGIADVLKRRGWEVYEEIHCVSSLDSNRRADIVAIHRTQSKGIILDPTIRFERDALQAQHVDEEKKSIYESCIPYLSEKYNLPTSQWSVSGLLFGARGTLPKFTWNILKALGLRFF
ncbi:hypothetical protein ANN_04102 [Periplaneta americana]|uniref:Reverse transcriptase domain-containing protein n=1 Tax=Periplaneta americana TaxID=6978 RepID=A0ABQ8TA20_PERAM|nr:hypothetical protein ANN_04102 [Periplaneta americana]